MLFVLHVQPHTVHFLKQHWYLPFPFRLIRIHLFYRMFFFLTYFFSKTLYHVPHTCGTYALTARTAYCFRSYTIWCLRYRHYNLFRKIFGNHTYLIHLHCLIQQIYICLFSIRCDCSVYSPTVFNSTVNCLYVGFSFSLIPVRFSFSLFCKLVIICFQNHLCNFTTKFTYMFKHFFL